jgi:hypothetical protein
LSAAAPASAVGEPVTVSGGQLLAQASTQDDTPPESASKR